jgi:hypothetical protein
MAATIKIIEVTSSTTHDKSAEMSAIKTSNLFAVRFLTRRIKLTIQAKKPVSFNRPTITIIPMRKRITSREENFITLSKSMVWVINSMEVPRKAKVRRKLQKNRVPNTEVQNIEMAVAW